MKQHNRLSMLKKLTFIGEKNINIFSSYIPDHYDEIYALYDLFNKTSLNYMDIDFEKPISKDRSFIFICNKNIEYFDPLIQYLRKINNTFTCMRNKTFSVSITNDKDFVHIEFKKS